MLTIIINKVESKVPITLMALQGELDGSNYLEVIAKAEELRTQGTEYVLIDMGELRFMSSAGLVALHSIALLMRGEQPPDPEAGWSAFHTLSHDRDQANVQRHVKILNCPPRVDLVLDRTGMKAFFEIHSDKDQALASFEYAQ